jgi:hypothetical protein
MKRIERAYQLFCKERFPLPSEREVQELETRLGCLLPADYRQYLLYYNGGLFAEPDIMPSSPECPLDGLTVMGGINASHHSAEMGMPKGFTPALFDDNDPPQILPIGYTMMGNLIFW